jgi:hypothetical protein
VAILDCHVVAQFTDNLKDILCVLSRIQDAQVNTVITERYEMPQDRCNDASRVSVQQDHDGHGCGHDT